MRRVQINASSYGTPGEAGTVEDDMVVWIGIKPFPIETAFRLPVAHLAPILQRCSARWADFRKWP